MRRLSLAVPALAGLALALLAGPARAEDSVRCVPRANEWAANRSLWRENRPALLDFRSRVPSNLCPGLIAEVDRAIASASAEVVAPAPPANPCAAADGRWSSLRASRDRAALQDFIDTTPTQCGARDAAMGRLASLAPPPVAKPTQTYNPPVAKPTQTYNVAAPYDVYQLDPSVRTAALNGRAAEGRANTAAANARDAAARAQSTGTRNARDGLGYEAWDSGDFAGYSYAGNYTGGLRSGVGVMIFGPGPKAENVLRYEGEWSNNLRNGVGVVIWRNGDRYAGSERNDTGGGPGVYRFADGRRYDGEWSSSKYNGYGVLWTPDGRVKQAGIWTDNTLTTPLGRQGQ